jgi:hypothetical protein
VAATRERHGNRDKRVNWTTLLGSLTALGSLAALAFVTALARGAFGALSSASSLIADVDAVTVTAIISVATSLACTVHAIKVVAKYP